MRKLLLFCLLIISLLFITTNKAKAIYDPRDTLNNKFGIHILHPSELSQAAELVNSSGGDWGYVIIPIQANDKNLVKWQLFMDDCAKYHLIPIIRIATTGDYFNKSAWSKPTVYDVIDFANFLTDLDWPTKNRFVVIFNETNRGDEWGGIPNASEYAEILSQSVDIFKNRNNDFFIISAGLDNASINVENVSVNNYNYMIQMNQAIPGIFEKIDGLGSHSYPNPGFSSPPSTSNKGVSSFLYQQELARELSNKTLPIFITETGWSLDKVSEGLQAQYYIQTFAKYWNNKDIVAVTPFILNSEDGPFAQFSFIKDNKENKVYSAYYNLPKIKGQPILNPLKKINIDSSNKLPTKTFKTFSLENIFNRIGGSNISFFKWLLGI